MKKYFFSKLIGSKNFLKHSFTLTTLNLITGILGYTYQIAMGRILEPSDFILFGSIMALTMFFTSPLGALMMIVSRRVAYIRAGEIDINLKSYYKKITTFVSFGLCAFLPIYLYGMESAQTYLKVANASPIILLGCIVALSALTSINLAFFQGMQSFLWLGSSGVLSVLLKILVSVFLVYVGFGVVGALMGVVVSLLIVLLIGYLVIWNLLIRTRLDGMGIPRFTTSITGAISVLIASIALGIMTQLDLVLVNWLFPGSEAGLYAAASVLGKAVLYLSGGISAVLFPMVVERHATQSSSKQLLFLSIAVTVAACSLASLVYWFFGDWIIEFFYGANYYGAGKLLGLYGFAMLPIGVVVIIEQYLIAKGTALFAWIFLAIAPVEVFLIYMYHPSLHAVIAIIGTCAFATAVIGVSILMRVHLGNE